MQPLPHFDALLLLALALASKRRPADLVEIIAAADLIEGAQGIVPSTQIIRESFQRLSANGLVSEKDGAFSLTADALSIVKELPRKADTQARVSSIEAAISIRPVTGEHTTIELAEKQIGIAILAHRAAGKSAGKNLLIPKHKPAEGAQKPGQRQRKPMPSRRRKD